MDQTEKRLNGVCDAKGCHARRYPGLLVCLFHYRQVVKEHLDGEKHFERKVLTGVL